MKVTIEIDVEDSRLKGLLALLEGTSSLSPKRPVTSGPETGTGWNPPATIKQRRKPAIPGRVRRSLTKEEVMFIATQYVQGNTLKQIAAKVSASESVISKVGQGSTYPEITGFEPWKGREGDRWDPCYFNRTPTGRLTARGKEVIEEESKRKKAGLDRATKARVKAAKKRNGAKPKRLLDS